MSDFKFSCPSCGQHISCDTSAGGRQFPCPTCQNPLTVPAAPPPIPPPRPASAIPASAAPPQRTLKPLPVLPEELLNAPTGGSRRSATRTKGYSGFAIAAVVCPLWVVLGCVPGVICAHRARAQLRQHPELKGRGLATAGMILSYVMVVVNVTALAALLTVRLHYRPVTQVRESATTPAAAAARVVDEVTVDDSGSEGNHSLEGQNLQLGNTAKERNRWTNRGGAFRYTLKVLPDQPMTLSCRYWGGEKRGPFEIGIEDQAIATQSLRASAPDHFIDVEYKIPAALTRGKTQVKVVFQARQGQETGRVYGCRMLKP